MFNIGLFANRWRGRASAFSSSSFLFHCSAKAHIPERAIHTCQNQIIDFPALTKPLRSRKFSYSQSFRGKAACTANARPSHKPVHSNHQYYEASDLRGPACRRMSVRRHSSSGQTACEATLQRRAVVQPYYTNNGMRRVRRGRKRAERFTENPQRNLSEDKRGKACGRLNAFHLHYPVSHKMASQLGELGKTAPVKFSSS